jgi:hypothetical protein
MTTTGNTLQIETDDSPSIIVDTPAYPGAYISNHGTEEFTGHSIPIYHSIPSASDNYMTTTGYGSNNQTALGYILSNKDKYVIVNPRYKLEVYQVPDYGHHKSGTQLSGYNVDNINFYTADNTNGTELLLYKVPTSDPEDIDLEIGSCKLFYKDDDDIVREVIPLKHSQITSTSGICNISTYYDPNDSNISFETVNLTHNNQTYKLAKFYYGGKIINTGPDIIVPCLLVGGGGSCGYASGTNYGSGGGGAGGYGEGTITLKRNVTYDISVGPGGVSTATDGPGGNPGVDTYIKGSDGSECRVYGGGAGCKSYPNSNMGNNSIDGNQSGSSGGGAFNGSQQQDTYYSVAPIGGKTTVVRDTFIHMSYYANKGGIGDEGGGSGGGAGGDGLTGSDGANTNGVRGGDGKQWIDGKWYAVGGNGGQYNGSGSVSGNTNYVRELGRGVGGSGSKGNQEHTTSGSSGICILAIPY